MNPSTSGFSTNFEARDVPGHRPFDEWPTGDAPSASSFDLDLDESLEAA